jgi:hypothetical protein
LSTKPLKLEYAEVELVRNLWLGNLVTFAVLSLGAFILAPVQSAISVAVGGAIALLNFRILERSISRALIPQMVEKQPVLGKALLKYYIRFAATAVAIIIMVRQGLVEPLGLLVGLSVVVVTIFIWGALHARKVYKEGV